MAALRIIERVRWFVAGPDPEERDRRRDRHYYVVKMSVSCAILGSLFLPASVNHLAAPVAVAANMLWIWIDP